MTPAARSIEDEPWPGMRAVLTRHGRRVPGGRPRAPAGESHAGRRGGRTTHRAGGHRAPGRTCRARSRAGRRHLWDARTHPCPHRRPEAPQPAEVAVGRLAAGECLGQRGELREPEEARAALTGALDRQPAQQSRRLGQAARLVVEDGNHTAAERRPRRRERGPVQRSPPCEATVDPCSGVAADQDAARRLGQSAGSAQYLTERDGLHDLDDQPWSRHRPAEREERRAGATRRPRVAEPRRPEAREQCDVRDGLGVVHDRRPAGDAGLRHRYRPPPGERALALEEADDGLGLSRDILLRGVGQDEPPDRPRSRAPLAHGELERGGPRVCTAVHIDDDVLGGDGRCRHLRTVENRGRRSSTSVRSLRLADPPARSRSRPRSGGRRPGSRRRACRHRELPAATAGEPARRTR